MFDNHEWQVFDIQKQWMLCHRQDISYSSIDTNNYIESWHNTLKRHFFRDKQHRRVDTVIYVLAILAVPRFQQKCMRSIVNVGPAQSKELRLKDLATEHIKTRAAKGYVGTYISQTSDLTLRVESFTTPTVAYEVTIDFFRTPAGHITQCTCPDFHMHRSCCKQIALVEIEAPPITFLRKDFWKHQARFHLGMLEPETYDDSDNTAPVVNHVAVFQRFALLEEIRDKDVDYPQMHLVKKKLEEALELYEATFPRKQGQGLNNKRPRQLY